MPSATPVTDHDRIREWVEEHGGRPACVKGTAALLRVDFGQPNESLQEISWDQWFDTFEESRLAALLAPGPRSRFFKLVEREENAGDGRGSSGRGRTATRGSTAKRAGAARSGGRKASGSRGGAGTRKAAASSRSSLKASGRGRTVKHASRAGGAGSTRKSASSAARSTASRSASARRGTAKRSGSAAGAKRAGSRTAAKKR